MLTKPPTDPCPELHVPSIHRHHTLCAELDSSVSIVIKRWALILRDWGYILERGQEIFLVHSVNTASEYQNKILHAHSDQGAELTTPVHLVPRLNMSRIITPHYYTLHGLVRN